MDESNVQLSLFPDFERRPLERMPCEYLGEVKKSCGYTKSAPREWTEEELEWILRLRNEGWSLKEIANSVGRTDVSVSVKLKRIGKKEYRYNEDHIKAKYDTNRKFLDYINPATVLDIYSGIKSWWKENAADAVVVTNDINKDADAQYHEKAEMLIHKLYYDGKKYDIIDLDPFGSAYECIDLAIKMARKGLAVTYGEMGHVRFNRLDFVRRYYGIKSMEEFTIGRLIEETQAIAGRNKKVLYPLYVCNWNRISRVYYEISGLKITEQWDVD